MPDASFDGRGIEHAESENPFGDYVTEYANKIRRGEIQSVADVYEIAVLGNDLDRDLTNMSRFTREHEGIRTTAYILSDGGLVRQADAETIFSMSSPEAWFVPETAEGGEEFLTTEDLRLAQKIFSGDDEVPEQPIVDVLDYRIPIELVSGIDHARRRVGEALGIINPYGFTLSQLAERIGWRLALNEQLLQYWQGEAEGLPRQSMGDGLAASSLVESEHNREADSEVDVDDTTSVLGGLLLPQPESLNLPALRTQPQTVPIQPSRSRTGDIEPIRRYSGEARSHRRQPNKWVRRLALASAAAILGLLVHHLATDGKVAEPARIVEHEPAPPALQPPASESLPIQPDHIMSIGGEYSADARTGTIWFNVEDYAAQRGHPHLTLLQTHLLTDRCINYMNDSPAPGGASRVPGGMSWDKATQLSPGIQLPYPPSEVMDDWIADVIAQTTQGTATDWSDVT